MTAVEIVNRHRASLQRLRQWRKDPRIPRSLAAELLDVSHPVFLTKLRAGLVIPEHDEGRELIRLSELERYCQSTISKRLKAGKQRKPVVPLQ